MPNDSSPILEITREEFEQFHPSRDPRMAALAEEVRWFRDEHKIVLGVLLLDKIDNDWSYVVLGRDEQRKYRGIVFDASIQTRAEAETRLLGSMRMAVAGGDRIFPQGDVAKCRRSLFVPVVTESSINPLFRRIAKDAHHAPARVMLQMIFNDLPNPDANFIPDFQSEGFDSRVWELYVFAVCKNIGLSVEQSHRSPDFLARRHQSLSWIEAVTARSSRSHDVEQLGLDEFEQEAILSYGSALYSKLGRRYWDLPHVNGHPLVIAMADFHHKSLYRPSSAYLTKYLFGKEAQTTIESSGLVTHKLRDVTEHRFGDKSIPSNFFGQPGAENISAILFSNSGTIAKFNRMAFSKEVFPLVRLVRYGLQFSTDERALLPTPFAYLVQGGDELWEEGVSVIHNPRAVHPLTETHFEGTSQHWIENDRFVDQVEGVFPFVSQTLTVHFETEELAMKFERVDAPRFMQEFVEDAHHKIKKHEIKL
jgi:hypothetical protein